MAKTLRYGGGMPSPSRSPDDSAMWPAAPLSWSDVREIPEAQEDGGEHDAAPVGHCSAIAHAQPQAPGHSRARR